MTRARAAHDESRGAADGANDAMGKAKKRVCRAGEAAKNQQARVDACQAEATSARERIKSATGEDKVALEENAVRIEERLQHLKSQRICSNGKATIQSNESIWYQIDQIEGIAAVEAGNQATQELVSNAANVDCVSLWGVGHEKISYIFLQVTKDVFIPVK